MSAPTASLRLRRRRISLLVKGRQIIDEQGEKIFR